MITKRYSSERDDNSHQHGIKESINRWIEANHRVIDGRHYDWNAHKYWNLNDSIVLGFKKNIFKNKPQLSL